MEFGAYIRRTIGRAVARSQVLAAVVLAVLGAGCSVADVCEVTVSGSVADTPEGTGAVLVVTHFEVEDAKVVGSTAAWIDTPNPDKQFAELLTHAAIQDAGLTVLLPYEVIETLERADLDPTYQPMPGQLEQFLDALGCSYYLTANVEEWDRSYSFFMDATETAFSVACVRAEDHAVLWRARGLCRSSSKTDREAARYALYDMFGKLKPGEPEAAGGPSPADGE